MRFARGFSLLELTVAVFIVGLLAGGLAWNGRHSVDRAGPRALAERLASECRALRGRAMATGVPVALVLPTTDAPAHCDSYYILEGVTEPRVVRSVRLGDEYPGAVIFSGHWNLTAGLLNEGPQDPAANGGDFDLATWGVPDPSHAIYVFLPSGAVVANRLQFAGAYHLLTCGSLNYSSETIDGVTSARLDAVEAAHTVKVSQAGLVSFQPAVVGALTLPGTTAGSPGTGSVPTWPGALPNNSPALDPLATLPVPIPASLPPGVDATVSESGRLTLVATATDPDGDPLVARWSADGGTFSGDATEMVFDGSHWVSSVDWTPPPTAAPNDVFTLGVTVEDGRGGSASDQIGAAGQVRVLLPGKITFMSARDGLMQIYAMNPDGTDQRRLSYSNQVEAMPRWSPDGARIAYMRDSVGGGDLWVMNADGTDQRMVVDHTTLAGVGGTEGCCWSPDGTRLAFNVRNGGVLDVYVVNADGTNPTRLAGGFGLESANCLEWHYDRPYNGSNLSSQRLLYFDATGGALMEIPLDGSAPNAIPLPDTPGGQEFSLSPRGDQVYYTGSTWTSYIVPYTPGSVGPPVATTSGGVTFRWSPDAANLCYDRHYNPLGINKLFRCNPDFSGEIPLTAPYPDDDEADWGP